MMRASINSWIMISVWQSTVKWMNHLFGKYLPVLLAIIIAKYADKYILKTYTPYTLAKTST